MARRAPKHGTLDGNGITTSHAFTEEQRKELSVFVSNVATQLADELTQMFAHTLRQFYATLADRGALVQAGVDRIQAEREAEAAFADEVASKTPPASAPPSRLIM